jgi:hypothetical protein
MLENYGDTPQKLSEVRNRPSWQHGNFFLNLFITLDRSSCGLGPQIMWAPCWQRVGPYGPVCQCPFRVKAGKLSPDPETHQDAQQRGFSSSIRRGWEKLGKLLNTHAEHVAYSRF